jgi:AraC-like DNA-binding protein
MTDSNPTQWLDDSVRRIEYEFTDEEPIRIGEHLHSSAGNSSFDMHYPLEIGIVLSGCMQRYYRDFEMSVEPGGVWLNGIWEPHGYKVTQSPCRVVVITVLPNYLAQLHPGTGKEFNWLAPFTVSPHQRPMPAPVDAKEIMDICRRLTERGADNKPDHKLHRRIYLMEMLLVLCREWKHSGSVSGKDEQTYAKLSHAVELVISSRKMITVNEASQVAGMSRNIFSRRFHQLMGVSFPNFCLRHRLSGAAAQLISTNNSLKETAHDWGFTDISHLHHRFAEHYGCTPAKYRLNS